MCENASEVGRESNLSIQAKANIFEINSIEINEENERIEIKKDIEV